MCGAERARLVSLTAAMGLENVVFVRCGVGAFEGYADV